MCTARQVSERNGGAVGDAAGVAENGTNVGGMHVVNE